MEILWKRTFSTELRRIARNSAETAFRQNFHTKKLGEITEIYGITEKHLNKVKNWPN